MLRVLLAATAIAIAAIPAHANQWWVTNAGTASGCVTATDDLTPAAFYKNIKPLPLADRPMPEIIDDGGPRVDIKYYEGTRSKLAHFFRTEAACVAFVKEIKAAADAEAKMLEKYK